ncbi:MAG: hypothetical protein DMD99_02480 [Candidatus Rokuibacteriota bacterium]|nr:MAG: hypothetical protein DMD99_02480 [Candidatus Rokubacteria bacterium]
MRSVVSSFLLAIALLVVAPAPSDAWRSGGGGHGGPWRHGGVHSRVVIGVGPAFWWGAPYPWYYPYYGYYPAPYYAYPPSPAVVEEPQAYAQVAPAPATPSEGYWYYCPSARAYYPTAPTCPEQWVKVPPRPE